MTKKKLLIALVAVLAIFAEIFFLPYRYAAMLPRRMYHDDDRVTYLTGAEPIEDRSDPSVKFCAKAASFVCKATVLTNGEKITEGNQKYTSFKMLVNDVWFGMPRDQILNIAVIGHPSGDISPKIGDRLLIFVGHIAKEDRERYGFDFEYVTVDRGSGIYIVNPDGKLFSLSKVLDFMTFEGQPPAVLKEHIREIRRELKKEK